MRLLSTTLLPASFLALLLPFAGVTSATAQDTPPADYESHWFRNIRQMTATDMGLARSGEAYFSPDVRRISFQAYPAGKDTYQIYVMNIDGTGLQMVSTGNGATTCSYFHPSGEKLLFASNHEDLRLPQTDAEVEPMRPRGGGEERPGGHPGTEAGAAATGSPATHSAGAGTASDRGRHGYAWTYYPGMELYEYTFASKQLKRLTFSDGYDAEGSYSPDGRFIVFSSLRDGEQEIYICDAHGSNPRRVTTQGKNGGPFFSPDGRRLVYRSDRCGDGNMQVFVSNVDGSGERALTGHGEFNWCPFWHPSGRWIVFTRADFRGRPNFDLYLIRDDGSQTFRVTTDQAFDGLPVFSPDGRYLMWTSSRGGLESPQVFLAEFIGLTPSGDLRAGVEPLPASRPAP